MMKKGVISKGIECPIIRQWDNIIDIVVDSVLKETEYQSELFKYNENTGKYDIPHGKELDYDIQDKDVIGITESIIARAAGQYITVDDIAVDIDKKFGKGATIALINPIYSRNRFSLILKGIARSASKVVIVMPEYDEVGNPRGVNPFTGVNIEEYYKELCESENCECKTLYMTSEQGKEWYLFSTDDWNTNTGVIYCGLHDYKHYKEYHPSTYTLADICSDKSPKYYEGNIEPDDNTIFVFGSNPEGRHGAGAAKIAREKFGAVYGCGEGLQGNSYAIPTKDLRVSYNKGLRSISTDKIIESIKEFYKVALENPDKKFKVAYRNTDNASLNGYTGLEMIDMFKKSGNIPSNVYFSKEWIDTGLFNIRNEWGLLGTNKATEDKLKLFPSKAEAQRVCDEVKKEIYWNTGKDVIVMAYGDGSYKDLETGIWEMADPVSSPGYTDKELLESTPNEIKVKYFADKGYSDEEIKSQILQDKKDLKGSMSSQGTTPRRYINLLASLMDLTSGSGDRCTPVVLVQNYF